MTWKSLGLDSTADEINRQMAADRAEEQQLTRAGRNVGVWRIGTAPRNRPEAFAALDYLRNLVGPARFRRDMLAALERHEQREQATRGAALMRERRHFVASRLELRADVELPAGVIGQLEGIALVYDVVDRHGTTFAPGCLERTIREHVNRGKVKLYVDHGDAPLTGMYDTHLHIGTVRKVWDGLTDEGKPCARFSADIFDTEAGRREYEYLTAVARTKSETGVSIGMLDEPVMTRNRITEALLREISITGEPSVPGTKVTTVRSEARKAVTLVPFEERLAFVQAARARHDFIDPDRR